MVSVYPARRCTSPLGVVPVGLGDGVGDCHDVANLPRVCLFISLLFLFWVKILYSFSKSMRVAKWEPTPCYRDAFSVGTPNWAFREKGWQKHFQTMFSLLGTFLFGKQKNIFLLWVCYFMDVPCW